MTSPTKYRTIPGIDGYFIDTALRVVRSDGKVMPSWPDPVGYPRVNLRVARGKRKVIRIHELVCAAFHGPRPKGMQVRHLDGSKDNLDPLNLCWGTAAENTRDRYRHGTVPFGTEHHNAKLNPKSVREIKVMLSSGFSATEIGKRFGVSRTTIRNINLRLIWRQVDAA